MSHMNILSRCKMKVLRISIAFHPICRYISSDDMINLKTDWHLLVLHTIPCSRAALPSLVPSLRNRARTLSDVVS